MVQSLHMPRVITATEEKEKPKRAPRKKVVKEVVPEDVAPVPVKRTRKKSVPQEEVVVEQASTRKAPTPIAEKKASSKNNRRQIFIVALLLVLGVGSSAAVGFSDKGSINVEETITYRNDQAKAAGDPIESMIPVQNTTQEVDGGLIGLGIGSPQTAPESNATTTASSTESVATSAAPVGQSPLSNEEAEAAAAQESVE